MLLKCNSINITQQELDLIVQQQAKYLHPKLFTISSALTGLR